MIVTFCNAVPKADYMLKVIMTNSNWFELDMRPHLDTVQFCPLKDEAVWRNIVINKTSLHWKGSSMVELSIDALLCMLRAGEKDSREACIRNVVLNDDRRLLLQLDNGNSIDIGIEPLLKYPLFNPLLNHGLWKTLQAKEHSLLWENANIRLELSMKTIIDYFA